MKKAVFSETELRELVSKGLTIFQIAEQKPCSVGTVTNYIKKYLIEIAPGFYSKGKKLGRKDGKWTENQRQKMLEYYKTHENPFKGKKHTEETKAKMRKNHADFSGDKNPFKKAAEKNPQLLEDLSKRVQDRWAGLSKEERYKINKKNIHEDISRYLWTRTKANANTRKIEFNITPEYAWRIWIEQDGKCALTGDILNLKSIYEITASLDRINSNQGYIEGNIQWLHKDVNIAKNRMNNEEFIKLCIKVVEKWRV
jgi:hypothetical protein